jgi:hypothetical protein
VIVSLAIDTDVLLTLLGCTTAVVIAVIEGRRQPVEESLRYRMDGIHDRVTKIEQKYMAYPPAREMLEQWASMESMYSSTMRRMDAVEGLTAQRAETNGTNNPQA